MLHSGQQSLDSYEQQVRGTLKLLASRLKLVEANVENSAADIRAKNQIELDGLNQRFKDIELKLEELLASEESTWDARRLELDTILTEMSRDVENALKLVDV